MQSVFIIAILISAVSLMILTYKMMARLNSILGLASSDRQYTLINSNGTIDPQTLKTYKILWSQKSEDGTPLPDDLLFKKYRGWCLAGYPIFIILVSIFFYFLLSY